MIDIFKKYTPEEACTFIGCDLKTLLPILKEMSKKKRCGVRTRGDSYSILGGEVSVIKYRLGSRRTLGLEHK